MNPLHLTATNFGRYGDLDIDLPVGAVAIVGPNGAGKSTLLNAIDVALFAGKGELRDLVTTGEDDLLLQLEFEHAGELYRVRRQYSARGAGKTTLDFEYWKTTPLHSGDDTGPSWEPLTREKIDQTQALVEETLGLIRATFRASSFLRQRDTAAFTDAKPAERQAVLHEILGLGLWKEWQDRARAELRVCEDELTAAAAKVEQARVIVARADEARDEHQAAVAERAAAVIAATEAEEKLEAAVKAHSAAAAREAAIAAANREHEVAVANHERLSGQLAEAKNATVELADRTIELGELRADADLVPKLEEQLRNARAQADAARTVREQRDQLTAEADQRATGRDRLVAQAAQMHADAQTARGKADHLDEHINDAGACDRCGQTLGAEAAGRASASYRQEADELDQRARTIDEQTEADLVEITAMRERAAAIEIPAVPDVDAVERDLGRARVAETRRATVAEQVRQLTEKASTVEDLEEHVEGAAAIVAEKLTAYEQAAAGRVDAEELERLVADARAALRQARETFESAAARLVRLDAEIDRIAEADQQIAAHAAETAEVQERVDVLKLAERAYGRDGIPALIVENAAIPQLEMEANRILEQMPTQAGVVFRVELRTQRALRSSDGLRDTLDIAVFEPRGERPYEFYSGGEQSRLNIALRIALARLLAHRRGAESRLLAVDEIEYLEEIGQEQLAQVLLGVAGEFDRVYVVSHSPMLKTAFDDVIEVENDGDRSRIAGARAAVAA